ncbi:MAG TPA: sugar-binding transcriptional regulator [Atribacteraceae bacterium]|nr:sugar-binding transcriptional regulator [Atribacteraceae bacterium]
MKEKWGSDRSLAARVGRLFYEDNLSILEIADLLGISRQRCSRILKRAKELGIVQIKILDPEQNRVRELEEFFLARFSLKRVVVVEVFSEDSELIRKSVGEAGAKLLNELLQPGFKIGVAYGRTLLHLVHYIKPRDNSFSNLGIVQLMGGLSRISANIVATEIPRRLAEALNAQVYYLPAPAFTRDRSTRNAMLTDEAILATLSERIDIALVGIGGVSPDSTLISTGAIAPEEFAELQEKRAVGDICGSYYDREGRMILFSGNDRRIAFSLDQLKEVPYVIGVVGGLEKSEAIFGALLGRLINVLVIDNLTAKAIQLYSR